MFKKHDWIIPAVALLLALIALTIRLALHTEAGAYARITVDGTEYACLELGTDVEITYTAPVGDRFTVRIQDGFVSVPYSDCPDKICVKHPRISKTGECIVCVPNKAVVEVLGSESTGLDAVSR